VIARWLALLTTMTAVGLFVLRMVIARPLVARVEGTSLRALTRAVVVATVVGLVAIPAYLEAATARRGASGRSERFAALADLAFGRASSTS
jgi:hypothetical protein